MSALSAIIGVVGGVLGIAAGMAIATVFAVVLWKRRIIKRGSYIDTYMNPVMQLHGYCTHIWLLKVRLRCVFMILTSTLLYRLHGQSNL